jgi:polyisoprenoid-binding protein YceI
MTCEKIRSVPDFVKEKRMLKSRRLFVRSALALVLAASTASSAYAEIITYEADKAHSNIIFKIRHLLSKTTGQFKDYKATVMIDPEKRDQVNVVAEIEVASIDTDEPKRDAHLKNEDFFDVAKFPKMTFTGSKLTDVNAERTKGKLEGKLTIKDVSRPVVLDVEWLGTAVDPWGNQKAAFSGETTINRKDFGIVWNKTLDAGGYLVGDEVEIEINIEAQIPKPAEAAK